MELSKEAALVEAVLLLESDPVELRKLATITSLPHEAALEAIVPQPAYPASWQGWRIALSPLDRPQDVEVLISAILAAEVGTVFHAHFIPSRD